MRLAVLPALIGLCFGLAASKGAAAEDTDVNTQKGSVLKWLADSQEADGHWDAKKFGAKLNADAGCTGLTLLAFLGAGYTSEEGAYRDAVLRAAKWIANKQDDTGCIGKGYEWPQSDGVGCTHAICGLAMAELYGITKDKELKMKFRDPVQKAVEYSLKQQTKSSGWGGAADAKPDLATTTWFVMQLKSARIAGGGTVTIKRDSSGKWVATEHKSPSDLTVKAGAGFQGAAAFLEDVTGKDGRAAARAGEEGSPVMTAAAMVCRQFMGTPNTDTALLDGAKHLVANPPDWGKAGAEGASDAGYCYWYWGTLAAFQQGGETWKRWNRAARGTLCDNRKADGSWEPRSSTDAAGGKIYSTTLAALTLEIYYRYLPLYAKDVEAPEARIETPAAE